MQLQGKRIINTRAAHQAEELTVKLQKHGAVVHEFPLIMIKEPGDTSNIRRAVMSLKNYDWVVFTSVNTVRYFFQFMKEMKVEMSLVERMKLASVGKKTLLALQELGLDAQVVPEQFDGVHLTEELVKVVRQGDRVLFPKSNLSSNHLIHVLESKGIKVDTPVVYETNFNSSFKNQLNELLSSEQIDIVTFTSPSTVHSFFKQVNVMDVNTLGLTFVVIGTVTASALKGHGINDMIVPTTFTIDGMVEAMLLR